MIEAYDRDERCQIVTLDKLDDRLWPQALDIYLRAFPEGKPEAILVAMFRKRMAYLHVVTDEQGVMAMAITGLTAQGKLLLIDYLAVREDRQGEGVGHAFFAAIRSWAQSELRVLGLLIEAEYGPAEDNESRVRFWQRCGFTLTEYVHSYIWVPERYRAMYAPLAPDADIPHDGQALFKHINDYHRRAFRGEA
ncbi:GNAT family N-acetyltransferase [Cohnella sp. GCM10027633]|uniref:GNAT family N-acetyltransferase n=1 Tax=unclassified Cohnella TaxID=2636738 RepID=UPI00363B0301